jgi:hypothetical protein
MDVRRVNGVTCRGAAVRLGIAATLRRATADRVFRPRQRTGTHSWEPCSLVVDGLECVFREVVDD